MEPNLAVISKKVWNSVRVAIFMIRKGLCKKKIFMDLNMMMKRGKLAGKAALGNLMFHNHHHHHNNNHHFSAYEGGAAVDRTNKRKNYHHHHKNSTQFFTPLPYFMQDGENVNLEDVHNMVEMMLRNEEDTNINYNDNAGGPTPLPANSGLGFWRNPAVRQLRITDSPFPVQNSEDSKHVDQAADDFIKRFYSKLQQQNYC